MLLAERSSPNDPRAPGVIIRGYYCDRVPSVVLDTTNECLGLFFGRVNVFGFTEVNAPGGFRSVDFLDIGICNRGHRLAPVGFLWDTQKDSVRCSLPQKAYCSRDAGFLAKNGTLQYYCAVHGKR